MQTSHHFDGRTYDPAKDQDRLNKQLGRVYSIMSDGQWYTLPGLKRISRRSFGANDSEAGVSARIRDLRKPKFGNYEVQTRRSRKNGLWEYKLVID